MSRHRRTALVLLAAIVGIAVAAAITYGTSQLVRQRIGLASEPITAGRTLIAPVPAVRRGARGATRTGTRAAPPASATAPTPATPSQTVGSVPPPTPAAPAEVAPEPAGGSATGAPRGEGSGTAGGAGGDGSRRDD